MSHKLAVNVPVGLARGLWGGTGSWLGVIVCLIVLICQSIHLGNLQRELSDIQKGKEDFKLEERRVSNTGETSLVQCPREKREVTGRRKRRHNGKRALIHLVPMSFSTDESMDITRVSWKVSLQEGKAFELKSEKAKVKHSGIYYIYSQVLHTDIVFTGQLVTRQAEGDTEMGDILLKCMQSMPPDKNESYNTCYSAGVFRLQKGDAISLIIPRRNASVDPHGYSTFMGLVKV